MPRRRCLAVVATSILIGVGIGACDTDDGREMREPTELQRWRQEGTSTTTTSTTTLPPTTPPILLTVPDSIPVDSSGDTSADTSAGSVAEDVADVSDAGLVTPGSGVTADSAAGPDGLTAPWTDGGEIDGAFTCDGAGEAPLIEWAEPPAGTTELALTVIDEDANGYVHWAVFGLPATAGSIGGGTTLDAGTEGRNSRSGTGWTGPCPPAGTSHQYRVTLHFLDQQLEETADAAPSALVAAIRALTFDEVSITGTYQRAG
ncbi:YbhB/YbcL family Raf kinase inhibitor-like protein [Desertimonas flava]|uniref:YbhB/YbcL family Raf kinase inhibitor-like protein n=1 Tax=Desertimonas flava TaxID=2064846 RepID=UPI000E34E289|nr:YbhB/YbcL family Raf kinase inhibitor-like protein [Desertimonas flava]